MSLTPATDYIHSELVRTFREWCHDRKREGVGSPNDITIANNLITETYCIRINEKDYVGAIGGVYQEGPGYFRMTASLKDVIEVLKEVFDFSILTE